MRQNSEYPLVSIIIATYKRTDTLSRAIESALNQTYKDIEIIVVDDNASKEFNQEVYKIIKSFSSNKIRYIRNEVNLGSASTRNKGIETANGNYITFLDDDDIYLENKVKRQLEYMLLEHSDFCITDLDLFSENNKLIENRTRYYIKLTDSKSLMKYHLMYHLTGTDTMMFRKQYIRDIGMFSPIDVGDEFYLMYKAIEGRGKFSYLKHCDVKAYVHTETDGISSGDSKITGEKTLFEFKKRHFKELSRAEIKFITMRHYAVLAFAELRRKNIAPFILNTFLSILQSPIQFIELILNMRS